MTNLLDFIPPSSNDMFDDVTADETPQPSAVKMARTKKELFSDDAYAVDLSLFYRTVTVQQVLSKHKKQLDLSIIYNDIDSDKFRRYLQVHGFCLQNLHHVTPNSSVTKRFTEALNTLDPSRRIAVAFHGTPSRNISSISQNSLDPKLRSGQAHGRGEYFGVNPITSLLYCRGDDVMMIFLVVLPLEYDHAIDDVVLGNQHEHNQTQRQRQHSMVVIEEYTHQLPIGTLSFSPPTNDMLNKASAAAQTQRQMEAQVQEIKIRTTSKARVAHIIQVIMKDGIHVAGELYERHVKSIRPVDLQTLRPYLAAFDDNLVAFYFPNLPENCNDDDEGEDNKTVEDLEQELQKAANQLKNHEETTVQIMS